MTSGAERRRCRRTPCCALIRRSTRRSPRGRAITLIVSAGPAKVKVPPVEGLTEAAARNQLTLEVCSPTWSLCPLRLVRTKTASSSRRAFPATESGRPGTTIRLQVGKAAPAPTTTLAPTTTPSTTRRPRLRRPPTWASRSPTGRRRSRRDRRSPTRSWPAMPDRWQSPARFVSDIMPSGLSGVTWTCGMAAPTARRSANGNINTFSIDIPAGGSVTFTVNGNRDRQPSGTLSNTVDDLDAQGVSLIRRRATTRPPTPTRSPDAVASGQRRRGLPSRKLRSRS